MPNLQGVITDTDGLGDYANQNMIKLIRDFAGGFGVISNQSYTGTGDGTLDDLEASPTSVTETWTLTATSATTFSVTGSVSGAQADATVGVAYDNTLISFTITDGATPFVASDVWTFDVTQGEMAAAGWSWEILRYNAPGTTDTPEVIMKGLGYAGTEEIFIGFQAYQDVGQDYYNISSFVSFGFIDSNNFYVQPTGAYTYTPAHNLNIQYWITFNPRRIAGALKVGTPVYESFYVGKFLPYARPDQYPSPLLSAGMTTTSTTRYSQTSTTTHQMPYKGSKAWCMMWTGTGWVQPGCWPWNAASSVVTMLRNTEGVYPLTPVTLTYDGFGIAGICDGVYHVSGFNNVVENTITLDGKNYIVIQDIFNTGFDDYYALLLED